MDNKWPINKDHTQIFIHVTSALLSITSLIGDFGRWEAGVVAEHYSIVG